MLRLWCVAKFSGRWVSLGMGDNSTYGALPRSDVLQLVHLTLEICEGFAGVVVGHRSLSKVPTLMPLALAATALTNGRPPAGLPFR